MAVSVSMPEATYVASADVKRLKASWYMVLRVRGMRSAARMMLRRPPSLRMATVMASTITVHTSVTASAAHPMPMDAPTALNDPAARLPDRLSYTFTNTGRMTATVKARMTDMTHSRAAG